MKNLDRKLLPALAATFLDNRLTGFCAHALQKPVAASSTARFWLVGSFRHNEGIPNNKSSIFYLPRKVNALFLLLLFAHIMNSFSTNY